MKFPNNIILIPKELKTLLDENKLKKNYNITISYSEEEQKSLNKLSKKRLLDLYIENLDVETEMTCVLPKLLYSSN